MESRWDDLGEFIREQRRVGHLSLRKLSDLAGISNPYLSQIERGLRKPSAEILQQIARALQISAETLYIRAGILEERTGTADLVGEILRDPFLNEDQKKTLVRIYDSFRHENGNVVVPGSVVAARSRQRVELVATWVASLRHAPPRHVVDAHVAARPAGRRRQRGHERLRAGAGLVAGPGRCRRRRVHPAQRRRRGRHRRRGARPAGRARRRRADRPRQGGPPRRRRRVHRRRARPASRAPTSTPSTPTTGCRAWPATGSSTSSTCRWCRRSTPWPG